MWESRNNILHDKDHTWQKSKRALWDGEISNIFKSNMEESFLQEDMKFFRWGKEKVLKMDDNPKKQWLGSIKRAKRGKGSEKAPTQMKQATQ